MKYSVGINMGTSGVVSASSGLILHNDRGRLAINGGRNANKALQDY